MFPLTGEELRELMRKEIIDLKRGVNEEVHEKEAVQKTANDLRNMVKRAEGEKTELSRLLQDARQKIAGMLRHLCSIRSVFFLHCFKSLISIPHFSGIGSLSETFHTHISL